MNNYYPEVHYSDTIKQLLRSEPPFRPKPTIPSRPEEDGCMSLSLPIIFIGGVVFIIIGSIVGGEVGGPYVVLGLIITIVLTLVFSRLKRRMKEELFQNSSSMRQYKEELDRWERERAWYMTRERLIEYRKQCYSELGTFEYHSSVYSDKDIKESVVQKGATESFFTLALSRSGLFTIHGSMHLDYYHHSYYPDIVISSADEKLLFDIEIDEPYAFEDHSPIHYIDEYGYSVDSDRNEAFVSRGFCVVRFSEEQIIRNTQECIDYLQAIINSIKAGRDDIPNPSSQLKQAKWTITEARQMANNDYRISYLPHDLQREANLPSGNGDVHEPHKYEVPDDLPF